MKILQINKLYYPVIGGIETVVKDIAEGLNGESDFQIDVLACRDKGPRQTEIINDVKVFRAASRGKALGMPLSLDFFKLFSEIKNNYDIIIIHHPFPLASIIAPSIPKEKLIIFYHCDIVRQKLFRLFFRPFIAASLKNSRKILVSGRNIISSSPLLKPLADKCVAVPFGFDDRLDAGDEFEAAAIKNRYSGGKKLLLGVGRLVYYKGFEYAVKAMASVDARLLIIGSGPQEKKLRQLIASLKLEEKIIIIPPQPRLKPYFLASDLFVFPSSRKSEAFGLVQLEALAAGRPIINTRLQTAVEEVSQDGISGLTVKTKNAGALATAINRLLNDDNLRKQFGLNARERYQKLFTKKIFLDRFRRALR